MSEPDDDTKLPNSREKNRYEASVKAYQFELDLFWKRSLFFWGFIGAAFIALTGKESTSRLQVIISSFGFVCSMVLTLVNRGSKFWYENWETKVQNAEILVTGELYSKPERKKPVSPDHMPKLERFGHWWFQAMKFSPSRLAIALSDYMAALWLCIVISKTAGMMQWKPSFRWILSRNGFTFLFALSSVAYGILLCGLCHTKDDTKQDARR